jgi:serine-type D-Ala-D-Ala carboxypeptidase/endopeptidase
MQQIAPPSRSNRDDSSSLAGTFLAMSSRMRCLFARLVFAASTALLSVTTPAAEADVPAAVNSAANTFVLDPAFVGASIGVWRNGREWTFGYGSTSRDSNELPNALTLYPIASITKTFAGSLLALAAVEGKLSLEDDVRKHLRGDFANLEFEGHPVRLRDLLNHRSGLPFLLPDRAELRPGFQGEPIERFAQRLDEAWRNYTRADFLVDLRNVTLDTVSGEKFAYSNSAAQLAGYVLENVEGVTFEQLLLKKIARPLRMRDTAITLSSSQRKRLASGYEGNVSWPPPPAALQAAGALKSTVADMLRYLRWHAEEKTAAVVLSHQATFREGNYSAALNWQILESRTSERDSRRLIWQEGNLPGYTSYLVFEPELGIGIVVLTNESGKSSSKRISTLCNSILKALDERSALLP